MHYLHRFVTIRHHLANISARITHRITEQPLNRFTTNSSVIRRYTIMSSPSKVCIVGSGNWGSAIARIVGNNVINNSKFQDRVDMWVFEETVNGKKLTEIINTEHENVKYLPGYKIPENVVAVPDLKEAANGADILVFVVPHQFVTGICDQLKDIVKPNSIAVSLIKGLNIKDKGLQLISHLIKSTLSIDCNVLMGANLAPEVAAGNFCETTIGVVKQEYGPLLKELFETETFRCVIVEDATTVELCGALKNVVAVGAGIVDGLGYGDNTKAAVIRLGLMEMVVFAQTFYQGVKTDTFLESCGVGDLVTTCYGGRNRRVAEAFVKTGKPIKQLEVEMLNGQSLQGPHTAREVNFMLKNKDMEDKFPLFTAIHRICADGLPPQEMIKCLHDHPEHL
ncbi:glycerol-3-phosphate dehydrogenase [NAD(+)], cytoplasmic-like isoform X2 [Ptychodera flava]|uniref:glycerol-3-phosphate dehydrogenase [NAD(+)], cytoplasmic-like isoform X2 n=1 Tax=Ptychodera flava TaxID=63121 RepID=UPI00396A363B